MKKDMSGFTIHEMENVARSIGPQDTLSFDIDVTNDIGNDSLGFGMLANNGGSSSNINSSRTINIDNTASTTKNFGGLSEIELNTIEPIEPITLNIGSSMSHAPVEIKFSKDSNDYKPSNGESSGSIFSNNQSSTMNFSTLSPAPAQQQQPNAGAFFGSSMQQSAPPMAQVPQSVAAMEPRQTARREMKGPSGVDDILKTFEDVRRVEADSPPPPPQNSALSEARSIATDDIGSTAGSQAGGRRGRRSRAPVIGNSFSLDA